MQPTVRLTRALPAERTVVAEASTSSTAGPSSNLPVVGRIIERLTVAEQTATCARGGSGRRRRRVRSNSTRREIKPTVHIVANQFPIPFHTYTKTAKKTPSALPFPSLFNYSRKQSLQQVQRDAQEELDYFKL